MQSLKKIKEEIEIRRREKAEIRKKIGDYVARKYGIRNFWELVDDFFGKEEPFSICLARQIATADIENTSVELLAQWMSKNDIPAKALSLSFVNDSYMGSNPEKLHYLKQKILKCGRKRIYVEGKKIATTKKKSSLDGATLKKIKTLEGHPITEHHSRQREEVGLEPAVDLSGFFLSLLQECLPEARPSYVFVEGKDIKELKINTQNLNGHKIIRPPASWYYTLYMFCFLDGDRVLLETTDSEPTVSAWIEKNEKLAKEICGHAPFILKGAEKIETQDLNSEFYEVPEWILKNQEWREKIEHPSEDLTVSEAQELLGRQLIEFCSK